MDNDTGFGTSRAAVDMDTGNGAACVGSSGGDDLGFRGVGGNEIAEEGEMFSVSVVAVEPSDIWGSSR